MNHGALYLIGVLFFSAALISAGGRNGASDEDGDGVVTVSFITWNSGYHIEIDQGLADSFMEVNPNIQVELISVPQGYDDKVLTSHAAGDTPDGLLMWNTPQFVEAGIVEDITPYIERDDYNMDQYHPVLKEWAYYQGGIYGLPKDYTPRAIYYNKRVFEEAGVPFPEAGWTFEDFKTIVEELTNGLSGAGARFGYVAIPGHTYAIQGYIWSNGGDLSSPDGRTATGYIDSPEVIEVVQWYKELYDMSVTTGTTDAYQNLGQNEFQTGVVGLMDNGSWPISVFIEDTSLDFGIVAPPVPRRGMRLSPVIHSSTHSMFAKAENKDAVWEYMKYVGGPAGGRYVEDKKYGISAIPSVSEISGLADDEYFGPMIEVGNAADTMPVFARNPRWFEADREFQLALEKIFIADADVESTLSDAAGKMDRILRGE